MILSTSVAQGSGSTGWFPVCAQDVDLGYTGYQLTLFLISIGTVSWLSTGSVSVEKRKRGGTGSPYG